MKNKKKILKSYVLQQAKINRLHEMLLENPEKETYYAFQIYECLSLRQHIENQISLVSNEVLRELLIQKYLCGKTLEEISYIINYSKRHTERLHTRALEIVEI
jgi:hypothetical protein